MNVLVTGVTGSLGRFTLPYLERDPKVKKIIGISRDELKQSLIPKYSKLELKIADVRDRDKIIELGEDIDIIFHFASLKRIEAIEENPYEAIQTNIQGTYNILSCQTFNGIKRIVFCSTDKSVFPINVYGATKLIGERIILSKGDNIVVRWANIVASRGSVIPYFIDRIKNKEPINLTSEDMARFFINLGDAVPFMLSKAMYGEKGVHIPIDFMRKAKLKDILKALGELLNVEINEKLINKIPVRRGEKMIENMISCYEPFIKEEIDDGCIKDYTYNELKEDLKKYI